MSLCKIFYAAIAILMLGPGCESPDCRSDRSNPKKGGLGAGVMGLMSGCYNERVADHKARLEETRKRNEDLNKDLHRLTEIKSRRQERLWSLRVEMKGFQAKVNNLKVQAANLRVRSAAKRKLLKKLQVKSEELGRKLDNWVEMERRAKFRIGGLETQRDKMVVEYDRLLQIYLALSQ